MRNIIIWDLEVFRYDFLLGAYIVDMDHLDNPVLIQTWDLDEVRSFYNLHNEDIWVGWNSNAYDDCVLEAVIKGVNPYVKSKEIIGKKYRSYCRFKLYSYDLLNGFLKPPSLKLTEALVGKSIDTTEVDFDLPRALTDEEKLQTEKYNKSDLNQTFYNFQKFYNKFELRIGLISEFGIPLQEGLRMTGTQIAAAALHAKANPALTYSPIHPVIPDTCKIKNQELIDWYLNEKFREGETLTLHICNTDVSIAAGGAHSKCDNYKCSKALYADISGYYNLIMINCDLLPRTLDAAGKEQYAYMYHSQLKLKKTNPAKRAIYKTICLSVFGAMGNEYTDFYDPWKGPLVTTTGEIFMWDLLEKLDGYGTAFNINTDGLMFDLFDWSNEEVVKNIIQEWVERNNFQVKTGIINDYYSRDVNCYIMKDPSGEICAKGDTFKAFDTSDEAYAAGAYFNTKEPPIIAKGIVAGLMDGILPEDFVKENHNKLEWFQYIAKKDSFKSLSYDKILPGKIKESQPVQSPSRVFANNQNEIGTIVKHKINKKGGHQTLTVPNLPNSIFVWNSEIKSDDAKKEIMSKLDYQYYINRIYEKLSEFL